MVKSLHIYDGSCWVIKPSGCGSGDVQRWQTNSHRQYLFLFNLENVLIYECIPCIPFRCGVEYLLLYNKYSTPHLKQTFEIIFKYFISMEIKVFWCVFSKRHWIWMNEMNEWMNWEWMNEWMNEWINEWMNEWCWQQNEINFAHRFAKLGSLRYALFKFELKIQTVYFLQRLTSYIKMSGVIQNK